MCQLRVSLVTLSVLLSACSNGQVYEIFRANQQQDCERQPGAEYRRCVAESPDGYEHYQRERDRLLETD